jgi:acyl-CoA thioester hydrolase
MLTEIPSDHRIEFLQEAYNEAGKLICKATILLYFMDTATNSKTNMPSMLVDKLQPYFQEA